MDADDADDLPDRLNPTHQLTLCCSICTVVTLGLFLLISYTTLKNPAFSVEKLYVPAFNKTANVTATDTIHFDIKLQNRNRRIGLYYDQPVKLTFSYIPTHTNDIFKWQYSVPKFYQGNDKSRRLRDEIKMLELDVPVWNQTVAAEHERILPSGAMMTGFEPLLFFKVDIIAKVRFKLIGKHHGKEMVLSALVPIDANTGEKFVKWPMKASAASGIDWSGAQVAVLAVSIAISTIFI